jgi:AraC-like DNA-binding protein
VAVLFDTRTEDPAERAERWSAAHERIFFPIDVRFTSAGPEHGRIEGHRIGPLHAYRVVSQSSVVRRRGRGIRASDPEQFIVGLPLRGRCLIEQEGRASSFGASDLSSWDSSHPFSVTTSRPFDLLLLVVPRQMLGPRSDAICRRATGRVSESSGVGAIAAPFFRSVWWSLDAPDSQISRDDVADGVVAMVRALHAKGATQASTASRLPGAMLLEEMRSYIDRHLGDPGLGPGSIARAHHVSTRYVHKLFATSGVSASDWVRKRRLDACWRDLGDQALADHTISEIASRWALTSPAHFSRVFRAEYGCSPSEARAAHGTRAALPR